MVAYWIISFFFFLLVLLAMSIGVFIDNKTIKGSCGGEGILGKNGEKISCDECPEKERKLCTNQS